MNMNIHQVKSVVLTASNKCSNSDGFYHRRALLITTASGEQIEITLFGDSIGDLAPINLQSGSIVQAYDTARRLSKTT